MASIYNTLQIRRGNDSDFNSVNPILAFGEPAYAVDTNVLKIGDGTSRWQDLVAFSNADSLSALSGILVSQINTAIDNLVDGAPDVLDTLNELAAAIGDDENFAATFIASGVQFLNNLYSVSGVLQTQIDDNASCCVMASGSLQEQIDAIEAAYISSVFDDKAPYLGGDLCLNGYNITCSGNIETTGVISSNSGIFDVVSFNTNDESVLYKGQMAWNDTEGTLDIGLNGGGHHMSVGESRFFRVRNDIGSDLYKGQVVYATGVHSNGLITPDKFIANGTINEIRFIGVVFYDIPNNNNGYVVDFGQVRDIDLDGSVSNYAVGDETWVAGDILYAHPTVAGKFTKVEPKDAISVAIILDPGNGNGNGKMFVRPNNFGHLSDNHDVSITSPASGDGLIYNSATSSWENVTVPKSDISGITGNASGVYNIVVVDSITYSGISPKDPNTLYFIP